MLFGQQSPYFKPVDDAFTQPRILQLTDLWNAEKRTFITYDDPESLSLKAAYIREHGLAGAMFWQYGDDPTGALLDVLHARLQAP